MRRALRLGVIVGGVAAGLAVVVACGSRRDGFADVSKPDGGGPAADEDPSNKSNADDPRLPPGDTRDPANCEEAKTTKSYVGCDYWPTVTPNPVWSVFDFALEVANPGTSSAEITVTGRAVDQKVTIAAGESKTLYLPWVSGLKGPDFDSCVNLPILTASVIESGGAYHLVSSAPVVVYQFNALQYDGKGAGGASSDGGAKDWSQCPARHCADRAVDCLSYSNEASLLLPSTAMTSNYRVTGMRGTPGAAAAGGSPPVLSVTATQDGTEIVTTLSSTAAVSASVAGPPVSATRSNDQLTITLARAGDVLELVGDVGRDFSGSLVQSSKPVQVIASNPCINLPKDKAACDHVEETVLPVETFGVHYVVAPPTGPQGTLVPHAVRFYGNKDSTRLDYTPVKPPQCPDVINAGEVVDCGLVGAAFDVTGTAEFAVTTLLLAAESYQGPIFDPAKRGDPSQSNVSPVEQFRTKYVFLAPTNYPVLWADITATDAADVELDGKRIAETWTSIGGPFGVFRLDLTKSGKVGAHVITAKKPVGVQVIGFGDGTSFQYPAGLNLNLIAPAPALSQN